MQQRHISINIYFLRLYDFLTIGVCNHYAHFILFTNSTVMFLFKLFKDARYFQIIFQSLFLSYGIFFLHWRNENWLYTTYFLTSLLAQFVCEYFLGKKNIPFLQRLKNGIPSVHSLNPSKNRFKYILFYYAFWL